MANDRRRFSSAAGLYGLTRHGLRHTAVAFWIAAGATPTEIAARAGHISVVTVLDRYGHLLPRSEDRVTELLDAMARSAHDTDEQLAIVVSLDAGTGRGRDRSKIGSRVPAF